MTQPHSDPTPEELLATAQSYPDHDDQVTILLGNFRRLYMERERLRARIEELEHEA